jgi:predicted phage terminase large subunit-like protein
VSRPQRSNNFQSGNIDVVKAQDLLSIPIDLVNKALAEMSLSEFVKAMWVTMDPHEYVHGWHIDAICEHAEAVINGEIRRLCVNIPPRHMKSLSLSVGLVPFAWLSKPQLQFVYFSYASTLSIRDGVKARRVLDSPQFKSWWGDRFSLTSDQNTKIRFDNDKGGYRISTSVSGVATGEGGDILVIDDANNVQEAESEIIRTGTNTWFDEVIQSRFNDPKTGALISIQQRSNAKDLTGHIMSKYGNDYTYLILPCKYEVESRRKNALRTFHGFTDPRTEEGELLWPDRFGPEEIATLEKGLGVFGTAGQLQQRPAPREGGMIPLEKFQRYTTMPARETWLRISVSFDTALKEAELNAYSVGQVWVETSRGLFLLYIWRKKCRYPELKRIATSICEEWQPHEVLIEDKSTGCVLIQDLQEERRFPIKPIEPGSMDKVMRMEVEATSIESGLCWLPMTAGVEIDSGMSVHQCGWLTEFEAECIDFPNSEYKDQIDPMSQYLKTVRQRRQKYVPIVSPLVNEFSRESYWMDNDDTQGADIWA